MGLQGLRALPRRFRLASCTILILCICSQLSDCDPLYCRNFFSGRRRGLREQPRIGASRGVSSTRTKPWRYAQTNPRRPQSYTQPQTTSYPYLDFETAIKDPRARVWNVDMKRRSIGKLSWTSRIVWFTVGAFMLQSWKPAVTSWGMKISDKILRGEELYRLVSPMFLHGGLLHLGTNMISLKRTGDDLEKLFGSGRFVATYVASGIVGNVVSAYMSPNPSLGASGAVFGVFGAYLAFLGKNEWILGGYGEAMTNIVTQTVAANLFLGAMNPVIDNWAHGGGALGGAVIAYVLGPRLYMTELPTGGRVIVDRPIVRAPKSIETAASRIGNFGGRIQTLLPSLPAGLERRALPWRRYRRVVKPLPNRSIRPKFD